MLYVKYILLFWKTAVNIIYVNLFLYAPYFQEPLVRIMCNKGPVACNKLQVNHGRALRKLNCSNVFSGILYTNILLYFNSTLDIEHVILTVYVTQIMMDLQDSMRSGLFTNLLNVMSYKT